MTVGTASYQHGNLKYQIILTAFSQGNKYSEYHVTKTKSRINIVHARQTALFWLFTRNIRLLHNQEVAIQSALVDMWLHKTII